MGCFIAHGCISQLPITDGDRVAGFICRIESSLVASNAIETVDSYRLLPFCPVMYGTYDDYGCFVPDKTKTTEILESFFGCDIDDVLKSFSDITYCMIPNEDDLKVLNVLVDKIDDTKQRWMRIHDIPENEKYKFCNRYCLVMEHESVVRNIIDSHTSMMKDILKHVTHKENPDWNDLYDEQWMFFVENGLNVYGAEELNIETVKGLWDYSSLLFPPGQNNTYRGLYANELMMDLFQNYPEMFAHAFDVDLKRDYVDTLKLFSVLQISQINMYINRISGHQFKNWPLWKTLTETYKNLTNDRHGW